MGGKGRIRMLFVLVSTAFVFNVLNKCCFLTKTWAEDANASLV